MPFSLNDRVLFGLLAVEGEDLRALLSGLEQIEADPVGASNGAALDHDGQMAYSAAAGRFRIYYRIARNGRVTFTELLA